MQSNKKGPRRQSADPKHDIATSSSNVTPNTPEANANDRTARRRALKERVARDLAMARHLLKRNWSIVPLQDRSKKPIPTWSAASPPITLDNVHEFFGKEPRNIGVQLGERSGGLVDLDLDSREARRFFPKFLPESACCGRVSSRGGHRFYIANIDKSIKFVDPLPVPAGYNKHEATHLELRNTGYTVCYGVHESGEEIVWENDLEPVSIDADWLKRQCENLAITAMLKRHWPRPGARHDVTAALVGLFTRLGTMSEEMMAQYVTVLNGGEGWLKHDPWTKDSARRWDNDRPFYGIPTLLRGLPKEVVYKLLEWLGVGISRDILEMNEIYAIAWTGSQAVILKEHYDDALRRDTVSFVDERSMRLAFANRWVEVKDPHKGNSRRVNLFEHWKQHPSRREYRSVIFLPGEEVEGAYNLWQGWAVEPDSQASCQLILQHIREIICAGDQTHFEYTVAWLADAVQHPSRRPGTCIVLRGGEGIGKGVFVQYVGAMYGSHFVQVTHSEHIAGRFNAHLQGAALIYVDEALFAGDRQHDSTLKSMITEDQTLLEQKFKDPITVRNVIRLIMASNHHWTIPAGIDARRYFVLEVPDVRVNDRVYFAALIAEQDAGGPAALMHYLLNYKIPADLDLRNPPKTAALLDQKHLTMDPFDKFLYGCLWNGEMPSERSYGVKETNDNWVSPTDEGRLWFPTQAFHQAFIGASQDQGDRFRLSSVQFGKRLAKLFDNNVIVKVKHVEVHQKSSGQDRQEGGYEVTTKRVRCYGFKKLADCRTAFEAALRQTVEWPVVEADDPF